MRFRTCSKNSQHELQKSLTVHGRTMWYLNNELPWIVAQIFHRMWNMAGTRHTAQAQVRYTLSFEISNMRSAVTTDVADIVNNSNMVCY